jgi:transcriptional regulator with XRE-family HTH domain
VQNVSRPFGDRLRTLRGDRGKSTFARFLGISNPSTYQNYEAGRIPNAQIVQEIATRCNVTTDWLLGREPIVKPDASTPRASTPLREIAAPPCRIPEGCNIIDRLNQQDAAIQELTAEVHTLTRLLGSSLAISSPSTAREKRKTG